jgi:tetratricopeptide (TPR) repeat protein
MSRTISKNKEQKELSLSFNVATAVLFVSVFIPFAYTIGTNFQKKTVVPEIKPAPKAVQQTPVVVSSGIDAALKQVADSPGYKSFLNLGLVYYNAGSYRESIEAWNKALKYESRSELLYTNIAAAYGALGMWDEEIVACEKALAINPNFDLAKRNLSWAKQMKSKR